jgi:hypothetical protein
LADDVDNEVAGREQVVEGGVFAEDVANGEEGCAEGMEAKEGEGFVSADEIQLANAFLKLKKKGIYLHCQKWKTADTAKAMAKKIGAAWLGA